MTTNVHFVGSIGLDTADEVFSTVGQMLGPHLKRIPDGEIGGRRLWISWQYPVLRSSPYVAADPRDLVPVVGFQRLKVADGVNSSEIHFGELGYAREARTSYQDFCNARQRGELPHDVRFQVSLPTPYEVLTMFCTAGALGQIYPAYERAMLGDIQSICAAIPHRDLALQWDVCHEMLMWDGRFPGNPRVPAMERVFADMFARICEPIPQEVELGFHLCYGDLDAKHFIDPIDTGKIVELANLLVANVKRRITWFHLPVPRDRDDDAYFAPLARLKCGPDTEIYLGLVHAMDGVEGVRRRMGVARKFLPEFGIATECGIARSRTKEAVKDLLRIHAAAVNEGIGAVPLASN